MIIAVDFDGALAAPHPYTAERVPLRRSAVKALRLLKRAGHVLVLTSPRANRALRVDPALDPLVRAGVRHVSREQWEAARGTHSARYRAMLDAVRPLGLFDAVDDGEQGPLVADLSIRGDTVVNGRSMATEPRRCWAEVAVTYGDLGLYDAA